MSQNWDKSMYLDDTVMLIIFDHSKCVWKRLVLTWHWMSFLTDGRQQTQVVGAWTKDSYSWLLGCIFFSVATDNYLKFDSRPNSSHELYLVFPSLPLLDVCYDCFYFYEQRSLYRMDMSERIYSSKTKKKKLPPQEFVWIKVGLLYILVKKWTFSTQTSRKQKGPSTSLITSQTSM